MLRSDHKDNIKVKERSDPTSTISITSATLNTVCRDSIYLLYRLMFRSDHKDNIKVKERSDQTSTITITSMTLNTIYKDLYLLDL